MAERPGGLAVRGIAFASARCHAGSTSGFTEGKTCGISEGLLIALAALPRGRFVLTGVEARFLTPGATFETYGRPCPRRDWSSRCDLGTDCHGSRCVHQHAGRPVDPRAARPRRQPLLPRHDRQGPLRRDGRGPADRPAGRWVHRRGRRMPRARSSAATARPSGSATRRASCAPPAPRRSGGHSAVRFQQLRDGVPVLGGELAVSLDASGDVLSAGGETLPPGAVDTSPQVGSNAARATAPPRSRRWRDVSGARLDATVPGSGSTTRGSSAGPDPTIPSLAWRLEVIGHGGARVDELVLVDAESGSVALHFNQIEQAKHRQVCDAENTTAEVPCTAPVATRAARPGAVADVNFAYDFAGDTYDFFFALRARQPRRRGPAPESTVRYCDPPQPCPYAERVLERPQMVYGEGFAAADDVVGHELTHGVTDFSSHPLLLLPVGRDQRVAVRRLRRVRRPDQRRGHRHAARRVAARRGHSPVRRDPQHGGPAGVQRPGPDDQPALHGRPDEQDGGGVHSTAASTTRRPS